mgnify:FL=1
MKNEHCMVHEKSLLTGVACQQTFFVLADIL